MSEIVALQDIERAGNYIAKSGLFGVVSIHAPAWGATQELLSKPEIIDVSIHAPAWGATP